MKTIQLSKEDYNDLIEMAKELREQENDGQASPRYWVPRSEQEIGSNEHQSDTFKLYDNNYSEEVELFDSAEHLEDYLLRFVQENDYCEELFEENYSDKEKGFTFSSDQIKEIEQTETFKNGWLEFLGEDSIRFSKFYYNHENVSEHNPSLFKSDVKGFIENNRHHLGSNPHTYANTSWRMPKMKRLVEILESIK